MPKKGIVFWLKFIFSLFILVLALQLMIPKYFERKTSDYIYGQVDELEALSVYIHSFPAPELFLGRVDRAGVKFKGLVIDGLPVNSGRLDFSGLKLESTPSGSAFTGGENTYLFLQIGEEQLNSYLEKKFSLPGVSVELSPGRIILTMGLEWFDRKLEFSLLGSLAVRGKSEIVFNGQRFNINGAEIPELIWEQLEEQARFSLDLSTLPFPVEVKQVLIRENELVILGRNEQDRQ